MYYFKIDVRSEREKLINIKYEDRKYYGKDVDSLTLQFEDHADYNEILKLLDSQNCFPSLVINIKTGQKDDSDFIRIKGDKKDICNIISPSLFPPFKKIQTYENFVFNLANSCFYGGPHFNADFLVNILEHSFKQPTFEDLTANILLSSVKGEYLNLPSRIKLLSILVNVYGKHECYGKAFLIYNVLEYLAYKYWFEVFDPSSFFSRDCQGYSNPSLEYLNFNIRMHSNSNSCAFIEGVMRDAYRAKYLGRHLIWKHHSYDSLIKDMLPFMTELVKKDKNIFFAIIKGSSNKTIQWEMAKVFFANYIKQFGFESAYQLALQLSDEDSKGLSFLLVTCAELYQQTVESYSQHDATSDQSASNLFSLIKILMTIHADFYPSLTEYFAKEFQSICSKEAMQNILYLTIFNMLVLNEGSFKKFTSLETKIRGDSISNVLSEMLKNEEASQNKILSSKLTRLHYFFKSHLNKEDKKQFKQEVEPILVFCEDIYPSKTMKNGH